MLYPVVSSQKLLPNCAMTITHLSFTPSSLTHHPSPIIPHPSSLTHHPSPIIPHPSSLTHYPSQWPLVIPPHMITYDYLPSSHMTISCHHLCLHFNHPLPSLFPYHTLPAAPSYPSHLLGLSFLSTSTPLHFPMQPALGVDDLHCLRPRRLLTPW